LTPPKKDLTASLPKRQYFYPEKPPLKNRKNIIYS